jgi:hypothetical protein
MGRLPTSPRNIFATGRLNGAKPSVAPQSAAAMSAVDNGSCPEKPISTSAAVIGITSATVIQSSPSMKFTRLTNQSAASSSKPRSIQRGRSGVICSVGGRANRIAAILTACSSSRGVTEIGRRSSIAPMVAIRIVAPNSTHSAGVAETERLAIEHPATSSATDITAMPAPCGVGTLWDDRAFGRAIA